MKRNYYFKTNCVSARGADITEMKDGAEQITRRTFLKYVSRETLAEMEVNLGYDRHHKQGLTMAQDWCVSYWKSEYRGKPCVYFDHSSIEYVYQKLR